MIDLIDMTDVVEQGRKLFAELLPAPQRVDRRGAPARQRRRIEQALRQQLAGPPSAAQELVIGVLTTTIVAAEELATKSLRGEAVDAAEITRLANAADRLMARLNLGRPAHPTVLSEKETTSS